jgi:hypothetical protein
MHINREARLSLVQVTTESSIAANHFVIGDNVAFAYKNSNPGDHADVGEVLKALER